MIASTTFLTQSRSHQNMSQFVRLSPASRARLSWRHNHTSVTFGEVFPLWEAWCWSQPTVSLESLLIFNMALERWFRTIVPRFPKIDHSPNLSERDVPEPIRPNRVSKAVVDKAWHVFSSLVSQIFFSIDLRSLPHSLPSYLVDSYLNQRCAGQRFLAPRGARPVCFTELGPPTPVVNSSKCPPNRPAPGNPHTRTARPRTDKSSDFPARPVDLTTEPAPPRKFFCVDIFSCFLLRVTQLMKKIDLSLRVRPHHFCRKK